MTKKNSRTSDVSERGDRFHLSDSYALGYLLLSEGSGEPARIADLVSKHWDSAGVQRQHLLDVGAADGRITNLLQAGFAHTETYEPNGILFALLQARLQAQSVSLHHDAWRMKTPLADSVSHSFFSHVLYHVPISRWKRLIEGAMRERPAGRVATFVLWNDDAEAHQFCRRVNPDRWHVTSENLAQFLQSMVHLSAGRWTLAIDALAPRVSVSTKPAAEAVATFLLGRRHPNTAAGRNAHKELVEILLGPGLDNSQSIFTLARQPGR